MNDFLVQSEKLSPFCGLSLSLGGNVLKEILFVKFIEIVFIYYNYKKNKE
jgi:hypothetical protein